MTFKIPKTIKQHGDVYTLRDMKIKGVGDKAVYNIVYRSGATDIKLSILGKDLEDEFAELRYD